MSDNTQGKLINVDLQPMADVLNNVINKMSEAVGWLMIPRGARKDMETATTIYIEGIKNDPALPDLVKAQKISRARKDIKEYCNLLDILEHAAQYGEIADCHPKRPSVPYSTVSVRHNRRSAKDKLTGREIARYN